MEYLVLRRFWSYGKLHKKGTIVQASEIRHPRLKMAEGTIVPAVSSSIVPQEPGDEEIQPQASEGTTEGEDTQSVDQPTAPAADEPPAEPKKPLFRV